VTLLFAIVRALHFASVMTIFGAAAFQFLSRGIARDARLRAPLAAASIVALLSAVASLCLVSAQMTGDPEAVFDIQVISTVAAQTFYGNIFLVRLALLVGLVLLCVADAAPALKALVAGMALALLSLTSHAAAAQADQFNYALTASDALHLLAAGFWTGGLVALLPSVLAKPFDTAKLVALLRLFSAWATAAVAILVIAGTVDGIAILDTHGMPWSNAYLTWLAIKLVLAGLMIALALTNRFGLMPGLARGEKEAVQTLPLTIFAELGCAGLILLVVGILGLTAPMQM
jgi:putative copper resistance protein D